MTVLRRSVADLDLTLSLPHRWRIRSDPAPDVVVAARSPVVPAGGFVPEIAMRAVVLDDHAAPAAGRDVEDADEFELAGHVVGYQRLGHVVETRQVVTEQWTWVLGDTALVLSGTVARADYADYCEVFEDVAATLQVTAAGPGSERPAAGRW